MSFDYCRKVVGYETNELALLRQMDEDGWEFVGCYGTGRYRDRDAIGAYFFFKRLKEGEK